MKPRSLRGAIGNAQAVAADRLDAGAEALRSRAPGTRIVERASARLEAAAYGLREHDLSTVFIAAVGVALVVGAIAGMALGRGRR
jgi:hypothetical protein